MHIVFNCCDEPFLFAVVRKLKESAQPLVRISAFSSGLFRELGNDVDVVDTKLLYRKETVYKAFPGIRPVPLDTSLLYTFRECREIFQRTLDRVFIVPRSVREHDVYFYELLSWVLGFFCKKEKIDCVFFDASPHFPWDIVIFFVAKFLSIEIRILRRTLIENRVVLDMDFRAHQGSFIQYSEGHPFQCEQDDGQPSRESFWIRQSKKVNSSLNDSRLSSKAMAFLTSFPWQLFFLITHYRNYGSGYMQMGFGRYLIKMSQQKWRVLILKEWLKKNCISPDLSQPFVYFALHFQPERTTDPEAGVFSHQMLAIRLLSETVPKGWSIFVKEHPRQVNSHPDVRYSHFRTVSDYKDIQSLPNVWMIYPDFDSDLLIDNCRFTASCTGSTVWEGMMKGKPGVNFGRVWHGACDSSPLIQSIDDARQAIDTLSRKSEVDVRNDVSSFLAMFRRSMIISSNYEQAARASAIPYEILVLNLADAILESLRQN